MTPAVRGIIGVVGFLLVYGLILWGVLRWARSRLLMRARLAAGSLTAVGAHVLEVRPSTGFGQPATVDFELDGRRGRFDVRHYGRDFILCSVRVESPPLPAMLVRAEGAADRMGRSLGLTREVQVGDADFDAAAYIVAAAPDEMVRSVLRPPVVRAQVRAILGLGYRVDMSRDGLRATLIQYSLTPFDGAPVPAVMRALEAMLPALPRVDPATLTTPRIPVVSVPAIVSLLGGGVAFAALLALAPVVHAPLDDTNTLRALGLGLLVWVAAMVVAVRAMRGHVRYLVELFLVALGLLVGVPSLTALGLMAANSQLDHSAPVTHRTTVLLKQRRDSELYVVPWDRDRRRQKVGVPRALWREVEPGEAIEVDTHPGALGWSWASDVRRAR